MHVARNGFGKGAEVRAGGESRARAGRALLLVLLAWVAAAGLPGAASADTGHNFLSQLPLLLINPEARVQAVTVDQTGNVCVADNTAGVVDVFDSSGTYKTQFGSGILESKAGNVEITGLAADSVGRIYVADNATDTVDVFKPNGSGGYSLLSEWTGLNTPTQAFGQPIQGLPGRAVGGVAVDNSASASDPSKGDVYVVDQVTSAVYVFKPREGAQEASEGEFLTILKGNPKLEAPTAVAVDSTTGSVYVTVEFESKPAIVEAFNSSGEFQFKIGSANTPNKPFGPASLAVEESTGAIYVATG